MRLLFVLSLVFAAPTAVPASGAGAEEKPAPAPAPEADAIAGAKRDFESMKAARAGLAQPKDATPRVSLPGLHTSPAEPARWPTAGSTAPEAKPDNWLVDAMEKGADVRRLRMRGEAERPQRESEGRLRFESRPDRGDDKTLAGPTTRGKDPALNPLTQFLSGWMTSRDYVLLQPALGGVPEAATPSGYGEMKARPLSGMPPSSVRGLESEIRPRTGERSALGPAAASVNPYLPPPPPDGSGSATSAAPALLPTVVSLPATISAGPPAPAPAGTSRIPEFARPAGDEKYFKQLKRF